MTEAGPLSAAELADLEATLLPALERHHLRLLAHSLRTLQTIAGRRDGPLPTVSEREAWIAGQQAIAADAGFHLAFAAQLTSAAQQLERLGVGLDRPPLALDLSDLIAWADAEARTRINRAAAMAAAPIPPPG